MSEIDELETIARESEAAEKIETAKEGELINKVQEMDDEQKMERAMTKAAVILGAASKGVNFIWPEITATSSDEFFQVGLPKTAAVLVKYDTGEPAPAWLKNIMDMVNRWKEEGELAAFIVQIGMQARAELKAAREAEAMEQEAADNGEKSEPRATE